MGVEDLITEMQAVKAEHTSLSVSEVLKIFEIKAMIDLTKEINRLVYK